MTDKEMSASQMHFERSENGVYFSETRPTQYTPGLLVEVYREKSKWTGAFFTFHEVHRCECSTHRECPYQSRLNGADTEGRTPCSMAPTSDRISTKIVLHSEEFKDLVNGMKHVYAAVPETDTSLSMEEKAAIEVASEMIWHFPATIIEEIQRRGA